MAGFKYFTYSGLVCFLLISIPSASSQGEVPPQIDFPNSQVPVIVEESQRLNYTLTCVASGLPVPRYQWKRNGRLIGNNDESVTSFTSGTLIGNNDESVTSFTSGTLIGNNDESVTSFTSGTLIGNNDESVTSFTNGTLYFKNFSDSDNGIYQCVATNSLGTSLSVNVPLWNNKPAQKWVGENVSTETETAKVDEGDPATLECGHTPDTVPRWSRRWYHSKGTTEVKMNHRIGTDSEGNLRFAYTKQEDIGSYICGLVPPVLKSIQSIIMYKTIQLIVTPRDTRLNQLLHTLHHSGDIKGILGGDVTLECFFSGNPVANITWYRGSLPISALDRGRFTVTDSGRRLTISNLEDGDEGEYVCEGSNGFDQKQQAMFVNVTSAPLKVPYHGLINTVVPDRKNIVLGCVAKASHGENLETPVWFRNGKLLKEDNLPDHERYSFNQDYTELHITQPNKSTDTASFQCNVSNSEGYTFYDGYLKVLESIKITKHPDRENEIYRNEDLDISVQATGDNCCHISHTWSHNGVRLSPADLQMPPFRIDDSGSLWFDARNVSYEHVNARSGRYQCNFSTVYDFQTFEFTISIKEEMPLTEALVAAKGGFEIWWIILICVVMLILVTVVIIVVVAKRNYPGDTYPLEKTEIKHHLNPKEDLLIHSFQQI